MCEHIHQVHALFHHNLPKIFTAPEINIDSLDDNISYIESMFDPNRDMCIYNKI